MGRKRFIISIAIVAFVVVSVISLLFQLGADEQVLGSFLPRIEDRLGVEGFVFARHQHKGVGTFRLEGCALMVPHAGKVTLQ